LSFYLDVLNEAVALSAVGGERKPFSPVERTLSGQCVLYGRQIHDFSSWDILGIGKCRQIHRSVQEGISQKGLSASSSRKMSGSTVELAHAEMEFSKFMGTECSLFCWSRNQAALSLISGILREGDVLIVSELSAHPAIDAAMLLGVTVESVNLEESNELCERIARYSVNRRRVILVDGVCPALGRLAPLREIAVVSAREGCGLIVDESMSLGLFGVLGRGALEVASPLAVDPIVIGSFGFAYGGLGGFISGPESVLRLVLDRSRALALEPAYSPAIARGIERTLSVIQDARQERVCLSPRVAPLQKVLEEFGLQKHDFDVYAAFLTMRFRSAREARLLHDALVTKGYLIDLDSIQVAVRGGGTLRVLIQNSHTETEIRGIQEALYECCRRVRGGSSTLDLLI
jgi:8-amino-7-oxononanoate synthase